MRGLRIILLAVCVSVTTVCLSVGGVLSPYVTGLKSMNQQEREKAAEAIREQHQQLIQELIELAAVKVKPVPSKSTQDVEYIRHAAKHLAIVLLGDLHAVEAVPVLLDNLEYRNPHILVFTSYLEEGQLYPATEALSKIGMPAVGPVIDKLGKFSEQEKGYSICCWIIKEILGLRLGKVRLEMAIEEAKDETVRKNLTAALPYFKTDQEKADEERAQREKAGKQSPASKTEK